MTTSLTISDSLASSSKSGRCKSGSTRRITLKDVAAESGVALSTASDILNGRSRCYASKKTADRVRAVADELGYVANANASALGGASSDLIGVVTQPLVSPYHALLVHHLSRILESQGYRILLSVASGSEAKQRRSIMDLLDQRAAGVICCTEHPTLLKHVEHTLEKKIPMALIGPSGAANNNIGVDLSEGGFIAGKHLVDIGRRKLVCLVDIREKDLNKSRRKGFSCAVKDKVESVEYLPIDATEVAHKTALEIADKILSKYQDADGIFAYSDAIALPLMRRLLDNGKRIPEDIAVVGFDNLPQSYYSAVPLTTIAQPIEEYAERAVATVLKQIDADGDIKEDVAPLECKLIIRASTNIACKYGSSEEKLMENSLKPKK